MGTAVHLHHSYYNFVSLMVQPFLIDSNEICPISGIRDAKVPRQMQKSDPNPTFAAKPIQSIFEMNIKPEFWSVQIDPDEFLR